MDQLPFDTPQRGRGGDTRTPQAKADIAKRENQIVELRLRNISYAAIGRVVGVSKTAVINEPTEITVHSSMLCAIPVLVQLLLPTQPTTRCSSRSKYIFG
jgi:hypothetical protein